MWLIFGGTESKGNLLQFDKDKKETKNSKDFEKKIPKKRDKFRVL